MLPDVKTILSILFGISVTAMLVYLYHWTAKPKWFHFLRRLKKKIKNRAKVVDFDHEKQIPVWKDWADEQ